MKIDPNGKMPPNNTITMGSINLSTKFIKIQMHNMPKNSYHFFSGIGLGTVFVRHGLLGWPDMLRPRIVPTSVSGKITNTQIQITAT